MAYRHCDTEHLRDYPDCYEECEHDICTGGTPVTGCYRVWFRDGTALLVDAVSSDNASAQAEQLARTHGNDSGVSKIERLN